MAPWIRNLSLRHRIAIELALQLGWFKSPLDFLHELWSMWDEDLMRGH